MSIKLLRIVLFCYFLLASFVIYAVEQNSYLFPITHYNQDVSHWLNPKAKNYNQVLLTDQYQKKRFDKLINAYFATSGSSHSPWNKDYIESVVSITGENSIVNQVTKLIKYCNNQILPESAIGYGMNYRPYSKEWLNTIIANINLKQLTRVVYADTNQAIATDNLLVRTLPTDDPFFMNPKSPGEGYPFDMLQDSMVNAGTPLYIVATSNDKKWLLVISPDTMHVAVWVHTTGVARVNQKFINTWQASANKNVAGVIQTGVSIIDNEGQYRFTGYIGIILPVNQVTDNKLTVLVPVRNIDGSGLIHVANISKDEMSILPLKITRANFAKLFKTLQGRPYGWGNLGFYNDCSAELKALFSMFGIYLPRYSGDQSLAGKVVDLSNQTPSQRLNYLMYKGVPLLTLLHINGHILLYVGNYTTKDGRQFPLSYQEVWGLVPSDRSYRAIIGESVFLPLLLHYQEDSRLFSQASRPVFELIYLNQ